jgi:hypothetical protein
MPASATRWKQLLLAVAPDARFSAPATTESLTFAEQQLGVALPQDLRDLLLEFDGATAEYGDDVVWSVAEIYKRNLEFRQNEEFRDLYMPFTHLLFFGGDGGGDQFAFAIQMDGEIHNPDIFRWEHETDSRSWFAGHLGQFLERRFSE